jgi:hypothetical protein
MEPLLMYLLKMLICSAVLYGYYRVALYNERFHQWNRFYLLAAMVLSVAVPFLHIPVMPGAEESNLANLISAMPWNAEEGVTKQQSVSWQHLILAFAAFTSVVFFLKVLVNITKILMAYKSNTVSTVQHNVKLIVTKLTQAPFSFFNWLFWRQDIDPASANGQRMLNHELTHIYERHSIDKLFTSLLLCIFWMNPFFWLMRNELTMIHEFLADRKAVHPHDVGALAEMILQGLPFTHPINNGLVNPFFSSQIKRRLLMITTSKDPKHTYLRRISGLALMVCSVFTLALSIQQSEAQNAGKKIVTREKSVNVKAGTAAEEKYERRKIIASTGDSVNLTTNKNRDHKNKNEVIISSDEKVKPKGKDTNESPVTIHKKEETVSRVAITSKLEEGKIDNSEHVPLYILDGKEINAAQMKDLVTKTIKSINVLKGEKAIDKYCEKGKNGVVEIALKNKDEQNTAKEKISIKANNKTTPLYYVDGSAVSTEAFNKISPEKIESVTVLKGEQAIKKYGEKGRDGVVEVSMKKPTT